MKDYKNKNQKVDLCTHAEMLNDENIVSVVADIASSEEVQYPEQNQKLYLLNKSDIKVNESTNKSCFDIYYEIYNRNFDRTVNTVGKRLQRKRKGRKTKNNH